MTRTKRSRGSKRITGLVLLVLALVVLVASGIRALFTDPESENPFLDLTEEEMEQLIDRSIYSIPPPPSSDSDEAKRARYEAWKKQEWEELVRQEEQLAREHAASKK